MYATRDVIIACDFPSGAETLDFLALFGERRPFVKIGMELFYSEGPDIVRKLKARGHHIFLDLKLHDIPNTVKRAMAVLSALDVDMVNLHAAGGSEMMKAAREGFGKKGFLIAVTQLTSTSEDMLHSELLIDQSMEEVVVSYAKNAVKSGLDGVVCSPLEARAIKNACGNPFLTVTPGIRFAGVDAGDQVRIATPKNARMMGADFIVVGRPITQSTDPLSAYRLAMADFLG